MCAKPELSKKTKKKKAEHPTAKAFAELMAETKAICHGDVIVSIRWRQEENRWKEGGEEGGRMKERGIHQDWRIDENSTDRGENEDG